MKLTFLFQLAQVLALVVFSDYICSSAALSLGAGQQNPYNPESGSGNQVGLGPEAARSPRRRSPRRHGGFDKTGLSPALLSFLKKKETDAEDDDSDDLGEGDKENRLWDGGPIKGTASSSALAERLMSGADVDTTRGPRGPRPPVAPKPKKFPPGLSGIPQPQPQQMPMPPMPPMPQMPPMPVPMPMPMPPSAPSDFPPPPPPSSLPPQPPYPVQYPVPPPQPYPAAYPLPVQPVDSSGSSLSKFYTPKPYGGAPPAQPAAVPPSSLPPPPPPPPPPAPPLPVQPVDRSGSSLSRFYSPKPYDGTPPAQPAVVPPSSLPSPSPPPPPPPPPPAPPLPPAPSSSQQGPWRSPSGRKLYTRK
ncbi:hypothetical protein OJ252_2133 [Cryptosporidium canis]|uniref:Uncharacterized protein n=1 Tax=Cryptosporidium canis TaxID=195482 RepID=A0ABQ8P632_9CRYT|nr:hypothetical protein OJ252_2133 [Cryptosporidium canis]